MTSYRVPLWAAGVASWPLLISVLWPDGSRARPVAWVAIAATAVAISLMAVDYAQRRRVWLAVLIVTNGVAGFLPLMGLAGSDYHAASALFYGWFMVLPLGSLVALVVAVAEAWAHRRRRWRARVEGSKVVLARRG